MRSDFLPGASSLDRAVQPLGGITESVQPLPERFRGGPQIHAVGCVSGNLAVLYPPEPGLRGQKWFGQRATGSAAAVDIESANTRTVVEALERYATSVVKRDEVIVATADELGTGCVDMDILPRCSEREYADPKCPLRPADKLAPIRWVRSYSLLQRSEVWAPLVMTHHDIRPRVSEAFWLPISTGVAAHTSLTRAIISAICEVVERDALTLTWLGRIPAPEIIFEREEADGDIQLASALEQSGAAFRVFDVTTDVGVPTAYGLQLRSGHPRLAQLVSCATGFDANQLRRKVLQELVQLGLAFWPSDRPENIEDFKELTDGATYMAVAERTERFDFLLKQKQWVSCPTPAGLTSQRDEIVLEWLTSRLRACGLETYLVELTTDDLRDAGVRVVRAIIPGLMPMSPFYRARYLGHPRLYNFMRSRYNPEFCEDDVNPDPQPFA